MRVLSFSVFDNKKDWQSLFYIRGLWFNVAMARIVYPDFKIHICVESGVFIKYFDLFQYLSEEYKADVLVKQPDTLCKMMLWRLIPVFFSNTEHVFCRDTDALVTYRESLAVRKFIESGKTISGIQDNPAHSLPLMGGLCGFKAGPIRSKYGTYERMMNLSPIEINGHGSDQEFLTKVVYRDFSKEYDCYKDIPRDRSHPLWTSDLCVFFIGAAGVNEFETLRYLRDKGIDLSIGGIGEKYKQIFYWL